MRCTRRPPASREQPLVNARRWAEWNERRKGIVITRIVKGIDGASAATGVVVVIDVLRAFTTAAYAFGAGIAEIELVATREEAFAAPGFRMGEVGGRLIPG